MVVVVDVDDVDDPTEVDVFLNVVVVLGAVVDGASNGDVVDVDVVEVPDSTTD